MPKLLKAIFVLSVALASGWLYSAGASAQSIHPIVDTGEGCLVGGLSEGKWLEADAVTPMLKGGERYRLYTLTKTVGDVVGEKPESMGEPCSDTQRVKFTVQTEPGIAVGGDWNALPRVPRMMSTNDPV